MIGRDTPMALCIHQCGTGTLVKVINLGYATLDGNEYTNLYNLAATKGQYISLIELEEEPRSYLDLLYSLS